MTATPESWDDIGCLRLQVDCLSHKFKDFEEFGKGSTAFHGLNDSQLQELRDKVELQEQGRKKERCLRETIAVLFGCVLALLFVIVMLFMIYIRSTQRPSDEASEATPLLPATFTLNASGFGWHANLNLAPDIQTNEDKRGHVRTGQQLKQKPVNNYAMKHKVAEELPTEPEHPERDNIEDRTETMKTMAFFEKVTSRRKLWKEAPQVTKKNPSASGTVVEKRETEPAQAHELEVQSAQLSGGSTDDEVHTQSVTKKDPKDAGEVAEDAKDKDSNEREDHEDGEQPIELLRNKPIDLGAVVSEDPAEEKIRESVKVTQDQPSLLTDHLKELPPLPHQSHGVFWVCFPERTSNRTFQKYASIFIEVARSQRWMIYPFCFVDRGSWNYDEFGDHFCGDDVKQLTFVMEKSESTEDIQTQSQVEECRHYMKYSEEYAEDSKQSIYRRTFPPEQEIQASLVEDFLYDVYSGRVPEVTPVTPPRRDL